MSTQIKPLKIYNASAGSGKTYTLVQAYLSIVLHHSDPIKFRSILAMTFTNKAANEMKARIISALIDLGTENHFKTKNQLIFLRSTAKNLNLGDRLIETRAKEILNKILHNYSSFSVMTIDKFTHKVIRTFAKDLDIAVDFNVEMDIKGFRKNITDMLIDQIGRNKKLTQLMLRYAHDNLKDDKSWNFANQILQFSDLLFKEDAIKSVSKLKELNDEDFLSIKEDLIKENSIIEKNIVSQSKTVIDLLKSKGLDQDDFIGKSRSVFPYFEKLLSGNYKLPSATLIKNASEDKWSNPKSPNAGTIESIVDIISKHFDQIHILLKEKLPKVKLNKSILKNLNNLSLLKYLLELIDKVKADENILLLSDFYKEIAEIISKEPVPFIYERLGVRYQHFLLDEFQDTSQLQWVNLIPLVHNSLAQQHDNLIVGDGKQAIYRWRNGEVEQFTKLPQEIHNPNQIKSLSEAENLFSQMGEKVTLDYNYRSAPEIVNFNNAFFNDLALKLDEQLGYIYDKHSQTPTKSFSGYIEGYFNDSINEEDQLTYVLESVQKAINAGFSQKDICIITRVNRAAASVANHLSQHDYNVISPESLFIGKDKTVKFLYFLMQSISNSNDRNAKIKTIEHYCSLNDISPSDYLIENESDYRNRTIQDFFKVKEFSFKAPEAFHNLYDFVEHLIEIFDFNVSKNPYLQFYLEGIHQFETNKNSNIRDYLTWFKEKGKEKSIISPEGSDAINIMTIHKSKGLQFPIVICPFFDWKLDLHKQISWIDNSNEKLPAFFINMTSELEETTLKEIFLSEKAKFTLDQYNLLYVAFTRPEIALFISGKSKIGITKNDILPAFERSGLFEEKENKLIYGSLVFPKDHQTKPTPKNIEINYVKQKMNKPELSYKSAMEWDIDELDQKRNFGTLIHFILSSLNTQSELESNIEKIGVKLGLSNTEKTEAFNYINPLFKNNAFSTYFELESWNEKEIIDLNGLKLIPDKVLIMANAIKVIDFKTGQSSPSHTKQVQQYIKTLKDMGHENVIGEICYTEQLEFVSVN